jgi:ABC-2 type transport system ATP-binding protein
MLEHATQDESAATQPQTILHVHDMSVIYGKMKAVNRLHLTVRTGEIYGFLGRNGAGKTSTIRAVMGVIKPHSGYIELLGYRGRRVRVKQKQRIGYVSQEQYFYPWMSCQELGRFVAGFYPTWDHDEFERLLTLLELPPRRRVSHLSGGMRVKLALALALAHRPPILILDEPTAGLDPVTRREFLQIISMQARAHNRTTFFSSHLIDEVERVADRVGIIHKGQLRYEGDIKTLQESVREVSHGPAFVDIVDADTAERDADFVLSGTSGPGGAADPTEEADGEGTEPIEAELAEPRDASLVCMEPQPGLTSGAAPQSAPSNVRSDDLARREFHELAAAGGFVVLRDGFSQAASSVLFGTADAWKRAAFGNRQIRRLSLEDIFISMAAEATPEL